MGHSISRCPPSPFCLLRVAYQGEIALGIRPPVTDISTLPQLIYAKLQLRPFLASQDCFHQRNSTNTRIRPHIQHEITSFSPIDTRGSSLPVPCPQALPSPSAFHRIARPSSTTRTRSYRWDPGLCVRVGPDASQEPLKLSYSIIVTFLLMQNLQNPLHPCVYIQWWPKVRGHWGNFR